MHAHVQETVCTTMSVRSNILLGVDTHYADM